MQESTGNAAHEPTPPAPPRWKGIQSLDLVYQLNERCMELLCNVAGDAGADVTLPIVTEDRALWARLEGGARRAAAQMPFIMVDAQFKNAAWWRRVVEHSNANGGAEQVTNGLPREAREHLMHETTMFAWQTARWDRTVAQMALGMSPSVTQVIASLTPHQIRVIATRESQAIRIRWCDDALFWRDLLVAATMQDEKKLAALHLHAKLLLCSELVQLRE